MRFNFLQRKKEEEKKDIKYILTIDGGGMRGIVPAYILQKINEELRKKKDRPLYSYFDLIAGTSTGALISLGLTSPVEGTSLIREEKDKFTVHHKYTTGRIFKKEYTEELGHIPFLASPENFVSLYRDNGKKIFLTKERRGLMKVMSTISRLFSDKYEIEPYEDFLSSLYGEVPLSRAAVPTMAVSYNVNKGEKYIFRSWDSHDFLVREAARATSAAPTYFAPAKFIDRATEEELTLIDGGIIANNPILAAYIEARKLYPKADEYRILSLSTASTTFHMSADDISHTFDWMGPLMRAYSSANMAISLEGVENIENVSVLRVWEDVITKPIKLDDTSPDAIDTLLGGAEAIWNKEKEKIVSFLDTMIDENRIPERLKLDKEREYQERRIEDKTSPSLALPSL